MGAAAEAGGRACPAHRRAGTSASDFRRWINEWDLLRLYPDAHPDIEETEFKISYEEDTALERKSPEESSDGLPQNSGL